MQHVAQHVALNVASNVVQQVAAFHTAQHSMQHVVQHVALNVASNVVQQVAAFNTYRAVCKFVACNSQQFRTNPILLSVACNTFKYRVQQPIKTRLSDHVTRRV